MKHARHRLSEAGSLALSRQLDAAVQRGDAPGVVALVVDRDGVLYEGCAGKLDVARNVPMISDAIFGIASMTKPITSVAIMMLLEDGKLRLDDPVSGHLTGFEDWRVIQAFDASDGSYEARPAKRPVTIRHLLAHTSGIGYAFTSPIVARLQEDTQKREWELPLLHDPGEKWTYGAGTTVLGMIVEKATGRSLEAYFQERIFGPLGMADTSFAVASNKQSRVPTIHDRTNGMLRERPRKAIDSTPTAPFEGDGGLYSTAQDYGLFVQMLLNGGTLGSVTLLTEESVRLMGENHIGALFVEQQPAADPIMTKPFPLVAGRDRFGLGFMIASEGDGDAKLRSPGSLSWAGVRNTHFWIDPRRHVAGVMLMHLYPFYDDGAIRTLRDFEQIVYQHLD
ncbi:MAG TPA: serine hydrolase domain-containing protein [Candidatus Tumulicola sp.]|nr:serine hydrolase domain-containing protein [Candidatus Tumulicola sp.]